MDKDQDVVSVFAHDPERASFSSPSTAGYGFVVPESELVANTRKGKQVLNVAGTDGGAASASPPRATCRDRSARTGRC